MEIRTAARIDFMKEILKDGEGQLKDYFSEVFESLFESGGEIWRFLALGSLINRFDYQTRRGSLKRGIISRTLLCYEQKLLARSSLATRSLTCWTKITF